MATLATLELLWIRCDMLDDEGEPQEAPPSLTLQAYFLGAYVGNPVLVQTSPTLFQNAIKAFEEPGDYLELHLNSQPLFVSRTYIRRLDTGDRETRFRAKQSAGNQYNCEITVCYRLSLSLAQLIVAYIQELAINTFLFIRSFVLTLFRPLIKLFGGASRSRDISDSKQKKR